MMTASLDGSRVHAPTAVSCRSGGPGADLSNSESPGDLGSRYTELYIIHDILYFIQYILHAIYCKLYTIQKYCVFDILHYLFYTLYIEISHVYRSFKIPFAQPQAPGAASETASRSAFPESPRPSESGTAVDEARGTPLIRIPIKNC